MANQRILPRFKDRERIGIFSVEDKKLIGEAETVDISLKGVSFETGADLKVNDKCLLVFGYLRVKQLEILTQILSKYTKTEKQCYSGKFLEEDMLKKNEIRSYVEAVRSGKNY